ncbi:MAG: right-handed parallel beta-helix repeat-containing protein [Phycisphaerae bacterium]|nr:right-handed parallel beta-helix repeat-containing protein [Phycisphaerae bacterium]
MKVIKVTAFVLIAALVFTGCKVRHIETDASEVSRFYVSPDISFSGDGSEDTPFATITEARDAVRGLIAEGLKGDVEVVLAGGTYIIDETLRFGLEDSAGDEFTVTYKAAFGQEPIISSAAKISGWKKLTQFPAGLANAAKGNVWVADVPETKGGNWRFHVLYDGEQTLPRARSKGFVPTGICPEPFLATRWTEKDTLEFPGDVIKDWENLEDIEILIRPTHQWLVNYLTLASVNEKRHIARTTVEGTYRLCEVVVNDLTESCWVENVIDYLDEPGEWVLNTQEGKVYYWPADGVIGNDIVAPKLRELLLVEGENVETVEGDIPVSGLIFEGLIFTCGDRDVWTSQDRGIQHDWDMFDKDNAVVRLRGARDCAIKDCVIRNAAGGGIRVDLYGQNIEISGNEIFNIGGTAILLCGYGPGNKDVNKGHLVQDNHIHDISQFYLHGPAFFIWQSGDNKILNNYVHDIPYDAVVLSGVRPRFFGVMDPIKWKGYKIPRNIRENMPLIRWDEVGEPKTAVEALKFAHSKNNLIQDNEFHNVMEELGDGNAIYFSCAGDDNIARRNLIYKTLKASNEIRFDDDQEHSTITENIIFGRGIKIKHTNYTTNNIIIGGGVAIRPETAVGSKVGRNIMYGKGGDVFFYNTNVHDIILKSAKDLKPLLKLARPDYNLFYSDNVRAGEEFVSMVKTLGHEENGLFADPMFVDLENGDLRFKQGSPANTLGIKEIDVSKIGLLDEPSFERLRKEGFAETIGIDALGSLTD